MLKKSMIFLVLFMFVTSSVLAGSNFIKSSIPEEVYEENNANYTLQYSIFIENFKNGTIYREDPDGTITHLGNVVRHTESTYQAADGFWAAQFSRSIDGNAGNVTATAVNALHLRVAPDNFYDPEQAQKGRDAVWKPRLISLLPDREYFKAGMGPHPGRIATDIPGGEGLFGGLSSAYVGSPVKYLNENGDWETIDEFYRQNDDDSAPENIKIEVYKPYTENGIASHIIFENEVGGDITLHYENGFSKPIATVLQRVEGTGRFGGSEYAEAGYVRANHGGVLDLSVSPYHGFTWDINVMGGFQIVPANHVIYSKYFLDLNYLDRPQWMIVGHYGATPDRLYDPTYFDENGLAYDPHYEAVAPLFSNYIKPKLVTNHDKISENANRNSVPVKPVKGQSTHFQFSFDGGKTWVDPEPTTGTHNDNLVDVTHIKLKLNY
ncbi:hypothetical protein J2S74_000391 [Evansella vedderi]|uniref:Uncharacterized protein n=1 Tax=Evansella vedderi TaxID=38282 RepID=A0ABT9ZP49_9BACI|nr:hypothetical protein [Evansella vedderi]MDQ0253019.1 hypothetical protein [Evansella vedderi]